MNSKHGQNGIVGENEAQRRSKPFGQQPKCDFDIPFAETNAKIFFQFRFQKFLKTKKLKYINILA